MLLTSDGNSFQIFVIELFAWCQWLSQCNKSVTNISNQPPISIQHLNTNNESVILVKMLQVSRFKMSWQINFFILQLDCHLANQKILTIVSIAHIMGKFAIPLARTQQFDRVHLKTDLKRTMLQCSRKIWT